MKSPDERLHDRLEQAKPQNWQTEQSASGFMSPEDERDAEIDGLVALARRLQTAPQVQADPDFARQLERRMLRRHAELRLQQTAKRSARFFVLRAHRVLGVVLSLSFLFLLLSTGVLVMAAQVSNPNNPLYLLKNWEQQVQISLASNAGDQAALELQFTRDRLNTLADLTDQAHIATYDQTVTDFDQQWNTTNAAINKLPPGSQHTHLANELAGLKADAIHVLHGLLPRLTLSERLVTTGELARLGAEVPRLTNVTLTLPAHPNGQATISVSGSNIQSGAQLLIDGRATGVAGTQQNGQIIFVIDWTGNQHPKSLGILNLDGTAAQITNITIKTRSDSSKNGNDKGNTNSNGNGSGNGNGSNGNGNKPNVTPTPHH